MKKRNIIIVIFMLLLTVFFVSNKSVNATNAKVNVWLQDHKTSDKQIDKSVFLDNIDQEFGADWVTLVDVYKFDIMAKSLTDQNEKLSFLEFELDLEDFGVEIIEVATHFIPTNTASPSTWDTVFGKNGTNHIISMTWESIPATGNTLYKEINTEGVLIGTVKIQVSIENISESFGINPIFDLSSSNVLDHIGVAGYTDGNGQYQYNETEITFSGIQIGDPNSTPDASLSSIDITGNTTNQIYDFNVDAEEIGGIIKNQITISYHDSINE